MAVPMKLPEWYDDPDNVLAFAQHYWSGPTYSQRGVVKEILDYFEKPWKWTPEYEEWRAA
jgi:hypothetical protein